MFYETKQLKYVVCRTAFGEAMVVFDELQSHKEAAAGRPVVSAGFLRLIHNGEKLKVQCFGESATLGIGSRPKDDLHLAEFMFNHEG